MAALPFERALPLGEASPSADMRFTTSSRKIAMSSGAEMPILTFSPEIPRILTLTLSPMMMLWLFLRVSTSTSPPAQLSLPRSDYPLLSSVPRRFPCMPGAAGFSRLAANGQTLFTPATEPDPRLGQAGQNRCLDRPSARGIRIGAARVPPPARPHRRRRRERHG